MWSALGFMLGILAFEYLPFFIGMAALVLTTLTGVIVHSSKVGINRSGILLVLGLFFLCGLQIRDRSLNDFKKDSFDLVYSPGDVYSAEVLSIANSKKTWNRALLRIDAITDDYWQNPTSEKVLFFVRKEINDIAVGDKIFCTTHLMPIENNNNPGEFDSKRYWQAKGISQMGFLSMDAYRVYGNKQGFLSKWFTNLDRSISRIFEEKLQSEAVGVAKAMILGDRDHLDAETVRSFGNSGAMHVLAVSGLHVGLILAMLIFVFSKFPKWISKYQATILAVMLIWFYAFLTGFSPSVFRAVVMFSMLSLAKVSGRQHNALNVLGASAVIILLFDCMLIYDLGFQLSYLAMAGIFVAYPLMKNLIYSRFKIVRWVWEGTSVALAAQLFTVPLTLYCFHQFPNYFLLSNIGLMVIANVILIAGVSFIALYKIPFVNVFLGWIVSISVMAMFYFVKWVDFLPGSVAKGFVLDPIQVGLFYVILLLIFLAFRLNWKFRMLFTGASALLICGFFVVQRYNQNKQDEFVVFNDNRLFFTLRKNKKIYCFYELEEYFGKVVYLAESYEKTRSGEIEYVKLDNDKEIKIKGKGLDFRCRHHVRYYEIDLNGKRIHITRRWNPDDEKLDKDVEVFLRHVDVTSEKAHKIDSGAFIYPI